MEKLITAAEVVALAFGGEENFRASEISDAAILAAQQKFIRPVLGGALCKAMEQNRQTTLHNTYLKPALALYIKFLVLPALAAQVSMAGVVAYIGEGYRSVDTVTFRRLLRRIRSDADALLDAAIDYIESNAALFPEYDPEQNIRNRVRLEGGVVL